MFKTHQTYKNPSMYNDIQKMLNDYFWKLLGNSLKRIGIKIYPNFPI